MRTFSSVVVSLARKLHRIKRRFPSNTAKNYSTDTTSKGWKCAVGLEIHAQLSTESKLFSSSPNRFGTPTNTCVSLFDAAIPGTLPVINKKAVELAVASALAFNCHINEVSLFDRKHYFYPDMPCGYQITQQRLPIAQNGSIQYAVYQPGKHDKPYYRVSKIKQIQLEQDSGKSIHDYHGNQSYVDLNRSGAPLIEIIFHPDVEDEEEACSLVKEVIQILQRVKACSCKLEEGALRIDANVSIHRKGEQLGVRTEIKNIGSIHGVVGAIKYEKQRQINIVEDGGTVKNETLMWDAMLKKTVLMRDKENSQDYRFMPEPNLPPLRLLIGDGESPFGDDNRANPSIRNKNGVVDLRHLKGKIPTRPQEDRMRLKDEYGLNDIFAYNLVNKEVLLTYFTQIMEENPSRNSKMTYTILMYQLLNELNIRNMAVEDCGIPSSYLGQIVDLLQKKRISKMTVEYLIKELLGDSKNSMSPFELVETKNLEIISNPRELRKYCLKIVEREVALVAAYKKRKKAIFNELVKKVIEETKFRADTQVLPSVMTEVLAEEFEKDH